VDGVLFDGLNWRYQSGKKTKSNQYLNALLAVAKYVQSKDTNLGIVSDENKAGFNMQWERQEKIDDKIKLIDNQFSGDGSAFFKAEIFSIWRYSDKTNTAS
jgi:hypothetical protein